MGKVYIKVQKQYFRPEDKEMYFTKSITYTKIGFDTLVKHVSADSGMSEAACEGAIRSIMKQVEEMVLNGHTIYIKQLGTLKMGISAKAPLDVEEAGAKQIRRRRLLYYPSTIIKDEIENTTLQCVTPLTTPAPTPPNP